MLSDIYGHLCDVIDNEYDTFAYTITHPSMYQTSITPSVTVLYPKNVNTTKMNYSTKACVLSYTSFWLCLSMYNYEYTYFVALPCHNPRLLIS